MPAPRHDSSPAAMAWQRLRAHALAYPGAYAEQPWGGHHYVVKVHRKIFVFLDCKEGGLSLTCKLPETNPLALGLTFTEPTGYGMAKHGWVTARIAAGEEIPEALFEEWLEESYRTIAPRSHLEQLEAGPPYPQQRYTRDAALQSRRVLLVGADALRRERAEQALDASGVGQLFQQDLESSRSFAAPVDLAVYDFGRQGSLVLELACEQRAPLFLAGLGSKKVETSALSKLSPRSHARHAPGDPTVVKKLHQVLRELED